VETAGTHAIAGSTGPQPVTFYVPGSSFEPIEISVAHSGLRMVLVNRASIRALSEEWKVLGIYFLLGPAETLPERYRIYVGEVGRRDLLLRLREHATQKQWWNRALLVTSQFNSAEIGWLEGRLYDVLREAVAADLVNKGRPGDDSIALKDRAVLERYVAPIIAALRACGAPADSEEQTSVRPKRRERITVKDLLEADLLKPGLHLHPTRTALNTTAIILEDGSLAVAGTAYASPSAAACAVSGRQAEAGWQFWRIALDNRGPVTLHELREELRARHAPSQQGAAA
jgi:hypothetical protein